MGQEEILLLLKENKGIWFSSKDVLEKIGTSKGSAITCLGKLRRQGFVEWKKEPVDGHARYLYRYKTKWS